MGRKVSREYNSNHKRGVQARGGLGRRRLFGGSGMWWIEIRVFGSLVLALVVTTVCIDSVLVGDMRILRRVRAEVRAFATRIRRGRERERERERE